MNRAMSGPIRRRRPGVEALEGRALLAAAGALDPSFGALGSTVLPIQPYLNELSSASNDNLAALTPSGQVVVVGSAPDPTYQPSPPIIERLNADGSPDPSFGSAGKVTLAQGIGDAQALAVQPDGSILVAGPITGLSDTFGVTRLGTDGAVDMSFGINGIALLPILAPADTPILGLSSMTLTPDGQIVVAGSRFEGSTPNVTEIFAARFSGQGTLDTTFGTAGLATVPITINGMTDATPSTVVVQPSGRIVVAGEAAVGPSAIAQQPIVEPVVIGLTTSGAVDPSFGDGSTGMLTLSALASSRPSPTSAFDSLAEEPDGSLVLEATVDIAGSAPGNIVRLTASGTLDPSFGDGGVVPVAGPLVPFGLGLEPDGKIVLPGLVVNTNPNSSQLVHEDFAAGRFNADGTPDPTFGQPATPGLETYPTTSDLASLRNALFDTSGHLILTGTAFQPAPPFTPYLDNYAGSDQVFRVDTSASITPALAQPPADYLNTGTTDYAVYLTASGTFAFLHQSSSSLDAVTFTFASPGAGQTIPALGDYEGLGYAQAAVYLPTFGDYAIDGTATSLGRLIQFGIPGPGQTIPVPADYEGSGKDDVAIYMPSIRSFAILPADGSPGKVIPFGQPGVGNSIPAPADYFGTGQADIAVYLSQIGAFAIRNPATGQDTVIPFGMPGVGKSIPVPADYDNSGHTELAVYIPSLGAFFYRPADGGADVEVKVGLAGVGELPVPGDYDGVGYDEFAVYDPTSGFFEYAPADGGPYVVKYFGSAKGGSVPVATPPADLPEFTAPGSGSAGNASRPNFDPSGSANSAPTNAITLGQSSAVPAGPTLASSRVALARVNQGVDDPSNPLA
jgi:uncharacterized delta-60 repeat protein